MFETSRRHETNKRPHHGRNLAVVTALAVAAAAGCSKNDEQPVTPETTAPPTTLVIPEAAPDQLELLSGNVRSYADRIARNANGGTRTPETNEDTVTQLAGDGTLRYRLATLYSPQAKPGRGNKFSPDDTQYVVLQSHVEPKARIQISKEHIGSEDEFTITVDDPGGKKTMYPTGGQTVGENLETFEVRQLDGAAVEGIDRLAQQIFAGAGVRN